MNSYIKLIPLGALLAFGAAGVSAQAPAPSNPTSAAPATVVVTPQEAAEANRKAVPRSDTGSVVRTSPSAEDKAKAAMAGNDTTTTTQGATPTTRRARADRN